MVEEEEVPDLNKHNLCIDQAGEVIVSHMVAVVTKTTYFFPIRTEGTLF